MINIWCPFHMKIIWKCFIWFIWFTYDAPFIWFTYVNHMWIIWFATYDLHMMPFFMILIWNKTYDSHMILICESYVAKLPVYTSVRSLFSNTEQRTNTLKHSTGSRSSQNRKSGLIVSLPEYCEVEKMKTIIYDLSLNNQMLRHTRK